MNKENTSNKNTKKKEDLPYNPDITKEDKQALNEKGRSMNKGQDKELDREKSTDFTADNMDIPGSNNSRPKRKSDLPDPENRQFNDKGERPDRKKDKDHPKSSDKI